MISSELRFSKINSILAEISRDVADAVEHQVGISSAIDLALHILSEESETSDTRSLTSFIGSLIDYQRHTTTQVDSHETARKGSHFLQNHARLMTHLLKSTLPEQENSISVDQIFTLQEQINSLFDSYLSLITKRRTDDPEVKSMNSMVNTLAYFKIAFPNAHFEPTSIHEDVHHKMDIKITIPGDLGQEKQTFWINLKATNNSTISIVKITNETDIEKVITTYQDEARISWNYTQKQKPGSKLLFILSPNKTADIQNIQHQAWQARNILFGEQSLFQEAISLEILDRHKLGQPIQAKLKKELGTNIDDEIIEFAIQLIRTNPSLQHKSWVLSKQGKEYVNPGLWDEYFKPAIREYFENRNLYYPEMD